MERKLEKFKASGRWWKIDAMTFTKDATRCGIGPEITRSKSKPYGQIVAFFKDAKGRYKAEYLPLAGSTFNPFFTPKKALGEWLCEVFHCPDLRPRVA